MSNLGMNVSLDNVDDCFGEETKEEEMISSKAKRKSSCSHDNFLNNHSYGQNNQGGGKSDEYDHDDWEIEDFLEERKKRDSKETIFGSGIAANKDNQAGDDKIAEELNTINHDRQYGHSLQTPENASVQVTSTSSRSSKPKSRGQNRESSPIAERVARSAKKSKGVTMKKQNNSSSETNKRKGKRKTSNDSNPNSSCESKKRGGKRRRKVPSSTTDKKTAKRNSTRSSEQRSILTSDKVGTVVDSQRSRITDEILLPTPNDPLHEKGKELWNMYREPPLQYLKYTKNPDPLGDWIYYPAKHGSSRNVKIRGIRGIHYATNYHELGELCDKYGSDIDAWPGLPVQVKIMGSEIQEQVIKSVNLPIGEIENITNPVKEPFNPATSGTERDEDGLLVTSFSS